MKLTNIEIVGNRLTAEVRGCGIKMDLDITGLYFFFKEFFKMEWKKAADKEALSEKV